MFNSRKIVSSLEAKTIVCMISGFIFMATVPGVSSAANDFAAACTKVTGFFGNFETILRVASVSIVTIAIVFAGYQIAFAHKRLSDVAPVLVGGLLIGGAATIAGWFVGDWKNTTTAGVTNTCVNPTL